MARIPTYNRQQTQQVAQKDFHVDSTASAVVGGLQKGISQASDLVSSVAKYEDVKAKQEYNINQAPRETAITNSLVKLNSDNKGIRESMADAPNPQKANQQLDKKFAELMDNPPQGLDNRSMEDWRHSMELERRRLSLQNLHWGESAAKRAGATATKKANLEIFDMRMNDARYAGLTHTGYSDGQLDIDGEGLYTDTHIPALQPENKKMQKIFHSEHFLGQAEVPLETPKDDPAIQGILGDNLDELEGTPETGWWIFGSKAKTKQEIGTEKINEYFDRVRSNIDNSNLSDTEKTDLKQYTDAQQRTRQREFETYIKASNLDLQKRMGTIPEPRLISQYYNQKLAEQKLSEEKGERLELNPIRSNRTVADIKSEDYLANLTFGNDYASYATKFEYAPMGNIDDFSTDLQTALRTLNIPAGQYTREELYQKYAPNNTINERQAIETLVKNNPYVEVVGLDSMNVENGFDESAWAHDIIQEISTMPTGTAEEKERQQAAINHGLYAAQKEINGGQGFIDKNLGKFFELALTGEKPSEDTMGYITSGFGGNPNLVFANTIMGLSKAMAGITDDYERKQAWSIFNKGVLDAYQQYNQDQDESQLRTNLRKINQNVLAQRYSGVVDINEMQRKLENHEPAIFTYDDKPYEYLGFEGNDVYVKIGRIQTKLGAK